MNMIPKFEQPILKDGGPINPEIAGVLACCRGDVFGVAVCCNM